MRELLRMYFYGKLKTNNKVKEISFILKKLKQAVNYMLQIGVWKKYKRKINKKVIRYCYVNKVSYIKRYSIFKKNH